MRERASFFWVKLQLSLKTIGWVMSQWRYAALALAIAVLFFELMYWLFNLSFLGIILASGNVTFLEKLNVLASPVQSIASVSGVHTLILMLLLSLLQGISIAMLTYIIRHQRKLDANLVGGSSLVGLLAIIGIGCPACGTSLLTPIVALFVSGSAVAVSERIIIFLLPFALAVGLYGLYAVGLKAANIRTKVHGSSNETLALVNVNDLQ